MTHMYFSVRTEGIRTFRHALSAAYRTAISAAQILVSLNFAVCGCLYKPSFHVSIPLLTELVRSLVRHVTLYHKQGLNQPERQIPHPAPPSWDPRDSAAPLFAIRHVVRSARILPSALSLLVLTHHDSHQFAFKTFFISAYYMAAIVFGNRNMWRCSHKLVIRICRPTHRLSQFYS